ncbi:(2Fe-2S) ferredoxin domain-containing protein [Legionella jordanis]|uniref:(2Fe-2S) ferredoxin n=1 Tax=Legionella jordanis TaxID=456 RepID=A0A0W0VBR2_9GAMM|nr:(2Fe-2S) ferredoxin domain-containing protein [Legionella jordanis]KTD17539.1 (2Fe-2S) ferredoxin [Legionella jordanis]RMX05123.1 (2Fe-2S) ferredoxin domain-containing protein [Legionella jordanis]RMX17379.1 (2Fe-2S) ferredoxin domain-containing protein [Legionella jordanis]VEH13508.1 (2Fe-2S) ferredoxin [Legionella jordanis]HAT8714425.1 (2Fe-2S) ferredoxin domain-containing protein [Legionella jordanis]
MAHYTKHVFLCTNQKIAGKTCCANAGGEPFFDYLKGKLLELGMHGPGKIRVSKSGCLGRCSEGPCIVIYPEGVWYTYATMADIDEIIARHLIAGDHVERLLIPN